MKIAIYTTYSDNNAELAALTHPNWHQYAARHGYHVIADKIPWEEAKVGALVRLKSLLSEYDAVLCIGTDVIFMNHRLKIERLITPTEVTAAKEHRVVVAREQLEWFPLNNDVMLWHNNASSHALVDRLIADAPTWLRFPFLWQSHIWNLMQDDETVADTIWLVEARVMNSTTFRGPTRWQLGDWIVHLLGTDLPCKIIMARSYLPLAGEPLFDPDKGPDKYGTSLVSPTPPPDPSRSRKKKGLRRLFERLSKKLKAPQHS